MTAKQSFCFCKFRSFTAERSYQSAVTYNRIMRDQRKKYNVVFLESSKQFVTHNNAKKQVVAVTFRQLNLKQDVSLRTFWGVEVFYKFIVTSCDFKLYSSCLKLRWLLRPQPSIQGLCKCILTSWSTVTGSQKSCQTSSIRKFLIE
jgi:hypothetical protein